MLVDDFLKLVANNKKELGPLLEKGFKGDFPRVSTSDIFARHLGFDLAPKKITDSELDTLVHAGSAIEALRGTGSQDVTRSFLSGMSGFGSYDEGGVGHFFAMESLSEADAKRLGLTIDVAKRGSSSSSMSYQATHYAADEGETIIRAALPSDARIATKSTLDDAIAGLRRGEGELATFRTGLVDSGNNKALNLFDNIFGSGVNNEENSALAGMMLGYDAATVHPSDNEIRVFNRSRLLATEGKSLEQIDAIYPRTKPNGPARGSMVKGLYTESHLDRRALLEQRALAQAAKNKKAGTVSAKVVKASSSATLPKVGTVAPSRAVRPGAIGGVSVAASRKAAAAASAAAPRPYTPLGRPIKFMEETLKLNTIRPAVKAAVTAAPPTAATAVVSGAATAAATAASSSGTSTAVREFLKRGVKAASGSSVVKRLGAEKSVIYGAAASVGLAVAVSNSKHKLKKAERDSRQRPM